MLNGQNKEGTFVEHLDELRWVIIRMLVSICVVFPIIFYFSEDLLELTVKSFCPVGMTLKFFSPVEPLIVKLRLSFYASIFLAAPYLLRQIWSFVAPGLYTRERSVTGWLLFVSWLLLLLGGAFALFVILPLVMSYSVGFESTYLQAAIGIGQFVGLVTMLMLGFGVMFQFPAAVFVVVSTGLVSVEGLKSYRAIVFIAILVISAFLTPPDVFSQLLMGVPTYLLFELGLLAASIAVPVKVAVKDEEDENCTSKNGEDCEKLYEETHLDDDKR